MSEFGLPVSPLVPSLVGVRTARAASLLLVQTVDDRVERGEPALIDLHGQLRLAVVEIPASMIIWAPSSASRGWLIAHGASDPQVHDLLVRRNVEAAAVAQATLGPDTPVRSAEYTLDGAQVTIHLAPFPTRPIADLIERLAAHLEAAIFLQPTEAGEGSLAGEISDVPDSLDRREMSQKRQDNQDRQLESDD